MLGDYQNLKTIDGNESPVSAPEIIRFMTDSGAADHSATQTNNPPETQTDEPSQTSSESTAVIFVESETTEEKVTTTAIAEYPAPSSAKEEMPTHSIVLGERREQSHERKTKGVSFIVLSLAALSLAIVGGITRKMRKN